MIRGCNWNQYCEINYEDEKKCEKKNGWMELRIGSWRKRRRINHWYNKVASSPKRIRWWSKRKRTPDICARSETKSKNFCQPASSRKCTHYHKACSILDYNGTISGRPNSIQITKLWRVKLANSIAVVELVKWVNAMNGKSDTCALY